MNSIKAFAVLAALFYAQPSFQVDVLPPAINEDLVAEGYIVVDHQALKRFRAEESSAAAAENALKQEVEYLLTQVNEFYESLRPYGLRLQLRVAELEILDYNLVSGSEITGVDVVEEKVILDNFGDYLGKARRGKDGYDFAMLLTGLDLSDPTAGYAQLGAMCDDYARGVVEMHGDFETAGTFAHELGHIFGAKHDPDGATYIMAPKASNDDDDNIFKFSMLTADFILKNLRNPLRNFDCLRQTAVSSTIPNLSAADFDGKMQDVKYLCKRAVDQKSTPCTSSFFYNNETSIAGDSVCYHVACRKPSDPKSCVTSVKTPEGMPCAKNKLCQRGKCVNAPSVKTSKANSECLFAEDKNPNAVMMSCPAYLKDKGGQLCAKPTWFSSCCETCPSYRTGWSDCPFGDSTVIWNGVKSTCSQIIADTGKNEACLNTLRQPCCGSCHIPDSLKGSSCPYGDDNFLNINSEKMTCSQAFNKFGKGQMCKNPYAKQRCCKSCEKPAGATASCPYGDEKFINLNSKRMTCADAMSQFGKNNVCQNDYVKEKCCETCAAPGSSSSSPAKSSDCPNGDERQVNINGEDMTCPQAVQNFGPNVCTNQQIKRACCKTCAKPQGSTSDCPNGDERQVNINGKDMTCPQAVQNFGHNLCTNQQIKRACCKTCAVPQGGTADCPYGDDDSVTVNSERITCSQAVLMYVDICTDTYIKEHCCKTCAATKTGTNPPDNCPDGDPASVVINGKSQTCQEGLATYGIYGLCNDWGKKTCCETCRVPPGAPKKCEYGDSETITIDGENYTCPDAASLFPKDWLCNALPQACCKTCS